MTQLFNEEVDVVFGEYDWADISKSWVPNPCSLPIKVSHDDG